MLRDFLSLQVTSCQIMSYHVMSAAATTRCVERRLSADWREPPQQISERCRDDGKAEEGRAAHNAAQAFGRKELDGDFFFLFEIVKSILRPYMSVRTS